MNTTTTFETLKEAYEAALIEAAGTKENMLVHIFLNSDQTFSIYCSADNKNAIASIKGWNLDVMDFEGQELTFEDKLKMTLSLHLDEWFEEFEKDLLFNIYY